MKRLVLEQIVYSGGFPSQTERYLTLGAHGSPLGKDTLSAGR